MDKPVIAVIKCKVRPLVDNTFIQYILVFTATGCNRTCTKEEALDAIAKYGLVLTLSTTDGKVWDTPDRAFQRQAREYIKGDRLKAYNFYRHFDNN